MRARMTSGVVAAITALALMAPTAGFAQQGGVPTKSQASCTPRTQGKHRDLGKSQGDITNAGKGRRCDVPAGG